MPQGVIEEDNICFEYKTSQVVMYLHIILVLGNGMGTHVGIYTIFWFEGYGLTKEWKGDMCASIKSDNTNAYSAT